jgi:hypothetical protein
MKLLLFLMAMVVSVNAYADLGGCVVYKAKYVMKDGRTITGFLPLQGHEDYAYLDDATHINRFCSDVEFQKLINTVFYAQQKTLNFKIYKQIHRVNYGRSANQKDSPSPDICAFTDSNSVLSLNLDSIKYTLFISAKNADWAYILTSIQLFDRKTCLMMQNREVVNHTYLFHDPVPESPTYIHEFDSYLVLNYNKDVSLITLNQWMKDISDRFYMPELNQIHAKIKSDNQLLEVEKERVSSQIIQELRQKGIILIYVQSTC